MGSSSTFPPTTPPSPGVLEVLRAAAGPEGRLTFARFMELALYNPVHGYYMRDNPRVGRSFDADFYTATSVGPVFGELVAAACARLLGGETKAARHTFVEIGAEPGGGVLRDVAHPFAALRTVRVGEPIALEGPCVVFSNELFDAQPVRRFVRRADVWRELGVNVAGDVLAEVELGPVAEGWLPADAPEGYVFDAPRAAADLAAAITDQPWHGLFVAFDYGLPLGELAANRPAGTLRAYRRHRQSNALLESPGEQDLTAHVCWDWLEAALADHRFPRPALESQESFFMKHAAGWLERTLAAEARQASPRKLAVMQLLHPGNMGQKFQVLHALRPPSENG